MSGYNFLLNKITAVVGKTGSGKTSLVNDIKKRIAINVNDEIDCNQSAWSKNWVTTYHTVPPPFARNNIDYYIFTSPITDENAKLFPDNVVALTQTFLHRPGRYVVYNVETNAFSEEVLTL